MAGLEAVKSTSSKRFTNLDAIRSAGSAAVSENGRALLNFIPEDDSFEEFYDVPLEELLHEARLQRMVEQSPDYGEAAPTIPLFELIRVHLLGKAPRRPAAAATDKEKTVSDKDGSNDTVSERGSAGFENANRMLKTASWGSVFYLITTDILGPTSAPYSLAQLGYVPGALLYFLFGICAAYTGVLIWNMFLRLDSAKYPLRNYGDIIGRLFGRYARYFIDFFQAVQLFCNVAVIILGNGQGLSQVAKGKACYTVLILVWALAGMIVGQIRSLQKFGFLANSAIWMNIFVIIATMACVSVQAPNFAAAANPKVHAGPVITKAIISGAGDNFTNQLNACMNIVYSYGGALVFVEFMAEMKRPMDFWKGMACAQAFIFSLYLLYGLIVYHYQGQFVANPANQGISHYGWQTACNVINLVSALIAAGLYGNVGIKVIYVSVFQRFFKFPELASKYGRFIWTGFVCIYWAIAFVFAAAIPNFSSLVSLVGAVCILQFTYTFPFLMQFGLDMQMGAMEADGDYDHVNKITHRIDSWKNLSRWWRGYKNHWFRNTCHFVLFLASLATAGLGIYSSAMSLKDAFADGSTTSFTCKSPVV